MRITYLGFVLIALGQAKCFEPTLAHPPPDYDPYNSILRQAIESIEAALVGIVAEPRYAANSFSIEVTSSQETLWSFHHTAFDRNKSRPDVPAVTGNALYRIASITKTFTVQGILQLHAAGHLSLDDTVNSYIKELGEKGAQGLPWKDITLRSLASQLSGIPRDCKVEHSSISLSGCMTLKDLLKELNSKKPLFAPNQQSTYSNVAFELLGLIIERVTNQSYEEYIKDAIFKPLEMSKSTFDLPPDSAGVIPSTPNYWDIDAGIQKPTGGIYASSSDISRYLRYILTHYNGITHALNWLHPVSSSRGLNSFYGMPWEIFHTDNVLKDSQRTIRFVTKGGSLPGYTSVIIMAPEYDLGITILLAGKPGLMSKLREIVTVAVVRAAEELAIQQLKQRYAGRFSSANSSLNSTMKLVADARGLVIEEWISNSTDILKSKFKTSPGEQYAQLVPTLLFHNEKEQEGEEWRVLITEDRKSGIGMIWDDFCLLDIDSLMYASVPLNEMIFWSKKKSGAFKSLEMAAFKANLTRVKHDGGAWRHYTQDNIEL